MTVELAVPVRGSSPMTKLRSGTWEILGRMSHRAVGKIRHVREYATKKEAIEAAAVTE